MSSKRNIVIYILVTYLLTWILWGVAFQGGGIVFRLIGSLVPSSVGVIFIGKKNNLGKNDLLTQLIKKIPWYMVAFIMCYTFLSLYIPYLMVHILQGNSGEFIIRENVSGFQVSNPLIAIVYFVAILFVGGPLGEELGWRGYLLPQLEEFVSPIVASIIIGIVWSFWHLPMFIFHINGYDLPLILYLLQTIHISFIFTWVYYRSRRSILSVILLHTMDNFVNSICYQPMLNDINFYSICYGGIQMMIGLGCINDLHKKRPYKK